MESKILDLLCENARMSIAEISSRIGVDVSTVENIIKDLEKRGVIRGYSAILNESETKSNKVKAIIEVKVTPSRDGGFDRVARHIAKYSEVIDLSLVSGGFDLLLTIEGNSLQEVASFVSAKLATIDGVLSTSTVFMLKKYKEYGRIMQNDEEYERLKVCP